MKMVQLRSVAAAALLVAGVATLAAAQALPIDSDPLRGRDSGVRGGGPREHAAAGGDRRHRQLQHRPVERRRCPRTSGPADGHPARVRRQRHGRRAALRRPRRDPRTSRGRWSSTRATTTPGASGCRRRRSPAELEQIIAAIHAELPETRVYAMSVKPSLARVAFWDKAQEANALYREGRRGRRPGALHRRRHPVPAGGRDGHGRHLHRRRPAPEREGHGHLGVDHQGGADGGRSAVRVDERLSGLRTRGAGARRPPRARPVEPGSAAPEEVA